MRNIKASALIAVLGISALLSIMIFGILYMISTSTKGNKNTSTDMQRYWIAECGAMIGKKRVALKSNDSLNSSIIMPPESLAIHIDSYWNVVIISNSINPIGRTVWTVDSKLKSNKTDEKILKRIRISNIMGTSSSFFPVFMGGDMSTSDWTRYATGDVFDGPIHANGILKIREKPLFKGRVTSSSLAPSQGVSGRQVTNNGVTTIQWSDIPAVTAKFAGDWYNDFGRGLWYTDADVTSAQTNLYDPNNKIFKAGYEDGQPPVVVPEIITEYSRIYNNNRTVKLDTILARAGVTYNSAKRVKLTFVPDGSATKLLVDVSKADGSGWRNQPKTVSLAGKEAVVANENYTEGVYVEGYLKNSMTIVTKKTDVVINNSIAPYRSSPYTLPGENDTEFGTLKNQINSSNVSIAIVAGLGFQTNSNIHGNIYIGRDAELNSGKVLIGANIMAMNGRFGVAKRDIRVDYGLDPGSMGSLKTSLSGENYSQIKTIALLGSVMMFNKGLFSSYGGIRTKFIQDPRAIIGMIAPFIKTMIVQEPNSPENQNELMDYEKWEIF